MTQPKKSRGGRPGGPAGARAAKTGGKPPPRPGRGPRRRGRGVVVAFGALFVLLLAGSAVFGGIGQAEVPDDAVAVIESTPGGTTVITREEFDRSLEQVAANERSDRIPEEGSQRWKTMAEAALTELINTAWVTGEAEEQGIEVTQRQIDAELGGVVEQFGCSAEQPPSQCQEFVQRAEQFKLTLDEIEEQVRTGLLGQELEKEILDRSEPPSDELLEDYYETFKSQYALPETRDVRLVLNKDRGKVEEAKRRLEEDSSDQAWKQVAQELSTDPASRTNGGLRPGLTEGLVEARLDAEIFAADEGEILGPVKTALGFYVFEVVKVTPARTRSLDEVRGELRAQLKQQIDSEARDEFINSYGAKWTSRTVCAEGFLYERCDNANGENDFASRSELAAAAKLKEDAALAMAGKAAWPKPPNALTLPLGGVGPAGTQIVCYLAEAGEGAAAPPIGTAPPQGPHKPGRYSEPSSPGAPPTCGASSPLGFTGSLPGGTAAP